MKVGECSDACLVADRDHEDGIVRLCQMTSDLTSIDLNQFTKHKNQWWRCHSEPTYYSVIYQIRFAPAVVANVEAELWFKDQKYSMPNSIHVEWQEGISASAP